MAPSEVCRALCALDRERYQSPLVEYEGARRVTLDWWGIDGRRLTVATGPTVEDAQLHRRWRDDGVYCVTDEPVSVRTLRSAWAWLWGEGE